MATIRLIPSAYTRSSTSRVTVIEPTNMYDNTDDTSDYCAIRGRNSSSYTYYCFIHGFNFDDVPSNAIVTGFRVLIRCYRNDYQNTGSSYRMRLASRASSSYVISDTTTSTDIDTTVNVIEIPTGSLDWDDIVGYGDGFSIDVVLRATTSQYPYVYVYGAEIEVTYTLPNPRTVTTTLTGSGTIDPSGTQTMYDGDEYNLTVEPTNVSDEVTATKNGTSITLTKHQGGATEETNVLGNYTLVSGSFNGSGASYFQGLVGKGYNNTQTTSNYYSGGSSTIAVFTYDVPFEGIPNNATIKSLYMLVNGHAESTSQSSEYMCARLISGSTNLSDELNFKSVGTSNSTQTVTANVTPTIAQLENLKVQCRLGYYGGAINGATVYLEYEVSGVWYTYSTTVDSDMTIVVTIGSPTPGTPKIYIKDGTETLVASKYAHDFGNNDLLSMDLSSFQNGDICHIVGQISSESSGSPYNIVSVDDTFIWSSTNEYIATNGTNSYTLQFFSNGIKITSPPVTLRLGENSSDPFLIYKATGGWIQYSKVYKKVNGSWVEQASSTWATLFNTNTNYRKME